MMVQEDQRTLASDDLWLVGYALKRGVRMVRTERDGGGWAMFHRADGDRQASQAREDYYRGAALVYARELAQAYRTVRRLSWIA